jgi:transcriptional regulator with XRE-family HTH domain
MVVERLGIALRSQRLKLGIKLREMARRLHVEPAYIVYLENDKKVPFRDYTIAKIADEYQLDIASVRKLALVTKYRREAESKGLIQAKEQLLLRCLEHWDHLPPEVVAHFRIILEGDWAGLAIELLGSRLRSRRMELQLTQKEIASRLERSQPFVPIYEREYRLPADEGTFSKLARAYELDVGEMLTLSRYSRFVRQARDEPTKAKTLLARALRQHWGKLNAETVARLAALLEELHRSSAPCSDSTPKG